MNSLNKIPKVHFLQSKEWEGFQRSLGREVFRVEGVLVTKLPLARGKSYLYGAGFVNFGPIFNSSNFKTFAKENNIVFLKYEPMTEGQGVKEELLDFGFTQSRKEVQPQNTIVLDLTKSEEDLLGKMHEKTRYNIRLASRKPNIKCQVSNSCDDFWDLIQKTAQRDRFSTHTREYYEKLVKSFDFSPTHPNHVKVFLAIHEGRAIAANLVLFHKDKAYYLHGASDYEHRNTMAPYLLHWEVIKYAKEQGCARYDLWGIDENKWPGVTRFKRGFGGQEVNYIGSFDYVFSPFWYKFYTLYRGFKLRNKA